MIEPGVIVMVRFPNADLLTGKLRPALVVAIAPEPDFDILLALITSRLYQVVSGFDEVIRSEDPDFVTSRLKVPSVVRLSRLVSVSPDVPEARLGVISRARLERIRHRIASWIRGASE